jgi:hypothetical protein
MTLDDAEKFFQYTMEGQLRNDLEASRKMNVQLSKIILDQHMELRKLKKRLATFEEKAAQVELKI